MDDAGGNPPNSALALGVVELGKNRLLSRASKCLY